MHISLLFLALLSAACAAPQPQAEAYAVVTVQMGTHSYDAIRWNRATGKAYLLRGQAWQEIPEADSNAVVPRGTYEVQFIPLLNDWGAIRINVETGDTWTMASGQWVAILSEPISEAQPNAPIVNEVEPEGATSIEPEEDTTPDRTK